MIILQQPILLTELREEHSNFYVKLVKFVVDIEKKIIGFDGEMHADIEKELLEQGSKQKYLWGGNLYFEHPRNLEYTSLINIRPALGNMSMDVQDIGIRKKIDEVVFQFILL
jgi:hypothetical protein